MDLFMCGVPLAASEDDVKVELAKILHKSPFPLDPPLNFDVFLFRKYDSRGKNGILTFPTKIAGQIFLQSYGTTGVPIKGPKVTFTSSNRALNEDRVRILNSTPWRNPQQLRAEKEQRIHEGRPYKLESYGFGRFLDDGSFSSEVVDKGSAEIACDLERRQVRFMLCNAPRFYMDSFDRMIDSELDIGTISIASYPPKAIDAIVESSKAEKPTIFIRANTFPMFAFEIRLPCDIETSRSQGLVPKVKMPPGCFHLACTFDDENDKDAFVHAARTRFQLRCTRKPDVIHIRHNIRRYPDWGLDHHFLRDLPFELAFEIDKAIANQTLSIHDVRSLVKKLNDLIAAHGDAVASIFRQFILLLDDEGTTRQWWCSSRNRKRKRTASTTLEDRLMEALEIYLREQARPKGRLAPALPSPAVSYTYHMILTPTCRILEGPVVDQSNSVLRRFGHHECFLRVSFQDENGSKLRQDAETSISELLDERYRPVLLYGCTVAGRHYDMLGYSMSGLKEHSLWFVTPFRDDQGQELDAVTIRESLGDFSRSDLQYQPARLGARWSQAFSATDPSITLEPEEIEIIDDIESPTTGEIMTDGCSPISMELSCAIWRANQKTKKRPARGRIPSAFQFRLGGAKGMVVQDPTLEGRVVCLRPSQVKFEAPDNRTFDIQSTSLRPKAMFLNRPLIVLLEYLGSNAEHIITLQERSINEARSIRDSFLNAAKVIQHHGLGVSFHLPSLFRNMDLILKVEMFNEKTGEGLHNDLIANALHCAETHILRELKYRAHIAVPGSFTLLGVSDEWDCLEEGEIFATVHDEKTKLYREITGTVAITRSPQIHPGDVKTVTAVRRKELEHLTNVVVFSCRGDRPLSSCLGGGDLDGDDFNLVLDPDLIPQMDMSPGDYESLPIKETDLPCGIEDVVDFIFDYIEADLIGQISIFHLRFSDISDPSCPDCLTLAELASQAVDFPKTGTPVRFRDLPKPRSREKPDFLAREGAYVNSEMYYNSPKLLGQLFRRVPVKDWMPKEWNDIQTPSGGNVVELALRQMNMYQLGLDLAAAPKELQEEMEYLLEDYSRRLMAVAATHTVSKNKDIHVTESELVSGTIMANWSDNHRRREAVGAVNLQTHELVRAVRAEMRASNHTTVHEPEEEEANSMYTHSLGGDWDDDEEDYYRETRQIAEAFKRAWAAWCAAERVLKDKPTSYGPQSFGLIALGRMLELIKAAVRRL